MYTPSKKQGGADTPRPRTALFMRLSKYSTIGISAIGSYCYLVRRKLTQEYIKL